MKKLFTGTALILLSAMAYAQITLPKTGGNPAGVISNFIKPPAIGNVNQTTAGIVSTLMKDLALPAANKSPLTSTIAGFLKQKQGIMSLAGSNPAGYLAKFTPMQKGLFDKLKGILGAAAFSKFMGMKPSGNNIGSNLLSNLFF